jgi:NADH-ubiquinone oxidoreductase chain 2
MQYSITNLDAFFVVLALGYLIQGSDVSFISQLKGQFQANPILGLSLAICLFSMAGIPPLVGFFAKYRVLYSAIENGYYFLAIVGILASVVSAAYYLRVIRVIHFDKNRQNTPGSLKRGTQRLTSVHSYVIAVLTLFILLFILSPSLLLNSSNLLALSLFTA